MFKPCLATALAVVSILMILSPTGALAHERRTVAGDYIFIVGFLKEPAFEGETNGLDLRVLRATDEQPVEGLESTLKAEVAVGPSAMPLSLRPRFRQPGAYNGEFVPTRSGGYTYRFTGTVEGRPVNEVFESGPGRFSDVQAVAPLQFPDKVPAVADLQRATAVAESRAASASLLAGAGLLVGLLGLVVAGWALVSRRSAPHAAAPGAARSTPLRERL